MDHAFQFCQTCVRDADKDRFLATLFAPERQRGPLFALYAFDAEIAQVRDRINSPLPGEVRLQWWRDVLTGTEPGDAAANPIAAALLDTVRRYALPVPMVLDAIDAHTFDLYDEPMATLTDLENYAVATSGNMISLAARILNDGIEPGHAAVFRHGGIAVTITALLHRLALHAARGQRYLPEDLMARHRAMATDLHAGRVTDELRAVLADLRRVVRQHLAALRAGGEDLAYRMVPAFLPVALVPSALTRLERRGADPFQPVVAPQWRRQWRLWRAARDPSRFMRVSHDQ